MTDVRAFDAVIFDWAGTIVDSGSRAPLAAFRQTFEAESLEVTDAEIRAPMGLGKREHIEALLALPRIGAAFRHHHGRDWGDADVDRMYQLFEAIQPAVAAARAAPIPGVVELIARLREADVKVGGTTGFSRRVMAEVTPAAHAHGLELDASVCVDDVARGRPEPDMLLECARQLAVDPGRCAVFDDTPVGVEAAVAAGMCAWGVSMSGNLCGLDASDVVALEAADRTRIHESAAGVFAAAGAEGTLESVAAVRVS